MSSWNTDLEARLKFKLGPEHPSTLTTLNNYCINLGDQGKFVQAVAMTERLLEMQEKATSPPCGL
jgi:hypothetical protein